MNKRYSIRFAQAMLFSREEAIRLHSPLVTADHLLLGLLREGTNSAIALLRHFTGDLSALRQDVEQELREHPEPRIEASPLSGMAPNEISLAPSATNVLKNCVVEAVRLNSDAVSSVHLLLALLKENGTIAEKALQNKGVGYDSVLHLLGKDETPAQKEEKADEAPHEEAQATAQEEERPHETTSQFDFDEEEEDEERPQAHGGATAAHRQGQNESETPWLDRYGTDITKQAQDGVLDPVVGREQEIQRIAQILSRRKKNNPVLIGEPGVGKTAIVEGLAQRIANHNVPPQLMNKRLVALQMAAMVAGTKYRGQFEERLQGVMDELTEHPEIILFIDEIHTIIGAGSAAGSMDAANMLKPALSRGQLQCIGATTTSEYRKSIEKDGALERRFQKVQVEPTTPEDTLKILFQIKDRYEQHHHVHYTDEALEACVRLSERYINSRFLPDKAIDAMDEAGSRARLTGATPPQELKQIEEQLANVRKAKDEAVAVQRFERAAGLRDEEMKLLEQMKQVRDEWESTLTANDAPVDVQDVEFTVSLMSGVPVERLSGSEAQRLGRMKDELERTVIGQEDAVTQLTRAITRNRLGLRDERRPIGTFLFVGPTGVGKTHLAQTLARELFGSEKALIRIDMSEYMEKFTSSRLVGAPPGYVGYDEGGQLTEQVRRHPYSVVLLDEIEKANHDVFNLLLQVMDEGRLTDSQGQTVDFRHTIIILTSNAGTRQLADFGRPLGFVGGGAQSAVPSHQEAEEETRAAQDARQRDIVKKALERQFAPEFLGRLDAIVHFRPLSREAVGRIADIELGRLRQRLKEQMGLRLYLSKDARELVIERGFQPQYGARPLRKAIRELVEDGLADFLLSGERNSKQNIVRVSRKKGEQYLRFH